MDWVYLVFPVNYVYGLVTFSLRCKVKKSPFPPLQMRLLEWKSGYHLLGLLSLPFPYEYLDSSCSDNLLNVMTITCNYFHQLGLVT